MSILSACRGAAADVAEPTSDARVANVAFKLVTQGLARCEHTQPAIGLVLRHLGQFSLDQRASAIRDYGLDAGPGVSVVVPAGPAAQAGVEPGDVVLTVNGAAPPAGNALEQKFDQQQAQAYSDRLDDLLESAAKPGPVAVTLRRDGKAVSARIVPLAGCVSRVHLARSEQRNAFADGLHVFITTKIVSLTHNDDELAFVLAHEIAHNVLDHAAEMRFAKVGKGPFRTFGHSGQLVRRTEREADILGADLARAAGYDPMRGVDFLHSVDTSPFHLSVGAAHDSVSARIAAIRAHLAKPADGRMSDGRQASAEAQPR